MIHYCLDFAQLYNSPTSLVYGLEESAGSAPHSESRSPPYARSLIR